MASRVIGFTRYMSHRNNAYPIRDAGDGVGEPDGIAPAQTLASPKGRPSAQRKSPLSGLFLLVQLLLRNG